MTEMFRCRVDKTILSALTRSASKWALHIRISPHLPQSRRQDGQLPFTPKAEAEEDEMLGPIERRREMLDYFHEH